MSITTALKARREAVRDREAGFTLIELLVVVIIIGILAAIAIPIYVGVQNSAKDSSVKQDLTSEKTAAETYATQNNGTLPTQAQFTKATLGALGWTANTADMKAGVVPTITAGDATHPGTFCVQAQSVTNAIFSATSSGGVSTLSCTAIGAANF